MSRYKFQLKPSGAIAPDVDLKIKLQVKQDQFVTESTEEHPEEISCENVFEGWAVAVERGNESALPGGSIRPWMFVEEDNPDRVSPYPDGCFAFQIKLIGTLCDGKTIVWDIYDGGANLPDYSIKEDQYNPKLFYFYHNNHVLTTPSVYNGSSITLTAYIDGNQFGVPIYFSYDGNAYDYYWDSWVVYELDLDTNLETIRSGYLFEEYQDSRVNTWSLNGYIWRAADTLTAVVTQTAGPPVTLPTVHVFQCTTWYLYRNVGESYKYTSFDVQMQVDGNNFGDVLTFTYAAI